MEMLASRTGGKAFYNTNDIMGSVRRAIDDSEVTYTLGFYLGQDELDSKFHDIKVKVDRKGVDIRARKGYLAFQEPPQTDQKRDRVIRAALDSALDANGLTIAARFDRADNIRPKAVAMTAFVDPLPFVFAVEDGKFTDAFDVVIVQQAADGKTVDVLAQVVNVTLTQERHKALLSQALELQRVIDPKPETRYVRLIVYDRGSGNAGSVRGSMSWLMSQPPGEVRLLKKDSK